MNSEVWIFNLGVFLLLFFILQGIKRAGLKAIFKNIHFAFESGISSIPHHFLAFLKKGLTGVLVVVGIIFLGGGEVMGQIALRGSSTSISNGGSITLTAPATLQIGDLMIVNIAESDDDSDDLGQGGYLNGWTTIYVDVFASSGNNRWAGAWLYKIADAGDVANRNFDFDADNQAESIVGGIAVFSGVDPTDPFDVIGTADTGNNDPIPADAIAPTTVGNAIVMLAMVANDRTFNDNSWNTNTPGPGNLALDEIFEQPYDRNNNNADLSVGGAWASNPNTGNTGDGSVNLGGNGSDRYATILLALKPGCSTIANSGPPMAAICQGGTSAALGGSVTGAATGGTWSSSAGGSFSPNANTLNATWTPPVGYSGTATLTLTTTGGSCSDTDSKTILVNENPSLTVGAPLPDICEGESTVGLGGLVFPGATGGIWTDGGIGGTFNPAPTVLNATWTPPSGYTGTATLTLTTTGGSCGSVTGTKTITVLPGATANPGGALAAICQGQTSAPMGGSIGGVATSGTWSGGSGTWTNANNPSTATYTAAPGESGLITLTLTTTGGTCGTTSASKTIQVNALPTANAGPALSGICQGQTTPAMGGSVGGSVAGGTWSGGSGTWTNPTNPATATYTAGASETGTITLTLTTVGGSCGVATATKTLTITTSPTANAGAALAEICDGETSAPMGGSIGGAATSGTWTNLNGTGTWTNANNPATATYTAGPTDSALGVITLQLTASGGSCSPAIVTKTITVNPGKTVTPVTTETVCFFTGDVNLTHSTTGVTGIAGDGVASANGLPDGVSATFDVLTGEISITGNATELGTFNYSIELLGTCGVAFATGTIIVEDCGCEETFDFSNTPSGTNNWIIPIGVTEVIVEAWGGGGRGGTRTSNGTGGGGGGGAYSRSIISVTPGQNFSYVIGAGSTTTSAGGSSRFYLTSVPGTDLVRAVGGNSVNTSSTGASGGDSNAGVGEVRYSGGDGADGSGSGGSRRGGGGGGGAGQSGNGEPGFGRFGGSNSNGGGDGGTAPDNSTTNGVNGSEIGGGGSGASRNSGSGTWTGGNGANGQIKLTYTLSAGVVNGPQSICIGGTTTFTSTMAGGVWSSTDETIATVNPTTGVITGVNSGAATIRYTITGCTVATASRTVFVNEPVSPGTLSGNQDICIGGDTQLLSSTSFGTWSSGNPAIATVSSTGLVTGLSAGTVDIFYTLPASGGCSAPQTSITVTVTTPPDAGTLSGTQEVCEGGTRTFASTTSGGIWSSGNPAVATVDPTTGIVTGVSAGSAILTYTVLGSGGCSDDFETRSITVTPLPDAGTLSGVNELCVGQSSVFTSTTLGGAWSSSNPAVASINSSTGEVTAVSSGTITITYTVAGSGSCPDDTATRSLTINPLPTPSFTAQPTGVVCIGEEVTYSTQAGQFDYDWQISGNAGTDFTITSGGTIISNSLTLIWLTQGSKQVFLSYSNSNGCSAAAFISSPISVSPLPTPTFSIEPTDDYCLGEVLTYTTQSGRANYTWNISGVQGTDYTIVSGGLTSNTISIEWLSTGSKTVTVNYDNAGGCAGATPASNTVNVNPVPVLTFILEPSGPVCIGQAVTYTTQSGGGISNYDWTISGADGIDYNITAGGTDETISIVWLTDGQKTVSVNYENSSGCLGNTPAISTIDIDPLPVPTFTAEPSNPTCIGDEVTYTTQAGQLSYLWTVSGVSGTDYNITAGGIGTSSNTVTIEWLTDGDKTVTVNYSNTNGCTNPIPATNTITLSPLPVPTFTTEPSNPVCIGQEVTYTTQAGQSNYVWTVLGTVGIDYTITTGGIGTTSNTVSIEWLTNGTKTVTVNYTDANGCTGVTPASNTIDLDPLPAPSFIVEPSNPVCLNDQVTYTTEGSQFDYDWDIQGVVGVDYNITGGGIGTGSNTVTIEWLTSGSKTVTVNYTDANGCSVPSPASNTIEISTPVSIDPVIDPGQVGDTECFGDGFDPLTITATGSGLTFQWYRKPDNSAIDTDPGTAVSGATSASFTPPSSPEGVSYYYVVVSGICGGPETSDLTGAYIVSPSGTSINIDLNPAAPNEEFCLGSGTFSQLLISATGDGGIPASYQWYQNTTPTNTGGILLTGETNPTFTPPSDASVADGLPRYYYATATSPSCGTVTSSISGAFIVNPLTSIDSENLTGDTICEGQGPFGPISVSASGTGTLSYQWYSNTSGVINTGVDTQVGTDSDTFTPPSNIAVGIPVYYYVVVSSTGGCGPNQTSSISGGFVVNELPAPTLTPAPTGEICVGTSITYTTESGQSNYVWNVAGVAGTDYSITAGGIGATDHTVTLTWLTAGTKDVSINYSNSNNCSAATATVISTIVNPLPVPNFTTAPPAEVCVGASVTYTTELGQSNYVWTIPGTPSTDYTITAGGIGTTDNSVTLTWLTDGTKDVSVSYTNTNNCTAAAATINSTVVNALPTPTFTTAPPAEVCVGTSVTYTTQTGQTNYTWTVQGTAGTDYTITSGGIGTSSNTVTLRWLTAGTKNVTINYTSPDNCTAVAAVVNSTIVNALPTPTFTAAPPTEVCVGESVTYSTESGQSNYIWTVPGVSGTDYTITAGGVGTSSNTVTLTWLTSGSKNVAINYTNATNCTAVTSVVNSTIVNALPAPTFTAEPTTDVCAGTSVTYTTQSGQENYVWTVSGSAGIDYTITSGGLGPFDNSVTLTWLSSGTKNVTVNYSNSNNCTAAAAISNTINVSPLPVPTFTTAPSSDLCIGTPVTYTTQTGQSNYVWTVSGTVGIDYTISGGGIGSGDNTVTLTWLTNGTKTVSVNYTNAGGCTAVAAVSNSTDVNVTPVITDISGTTICSGDTFTVTPLNGVNGSVPTGTTYTWTVSANGNVTGEANVATPQASISQTLTNTSLVAQTVTYTVTPTTPDGCIGNTFEVDVEVRPMPTVNPISNQDVGCSGQSTTAVNFSGNGVSGVVYNWTNSHPSIGLAASGTGNIPAFVAANPSSGPITATITVTPTANGCSGPSQSFTITVDPTPVITLQADYCAVDGSVVLVASSNVTGTTWSWNTGETTPSITVNIAGSYSVTGTSPDGCVSSASISIAEELIVDGSFTNYDPANPSFFTEYGTNQVSQYLRRFGNGSVNGATGLWPEGLYAVDESAWSPSDNVGYHTNFHGRDHTNNATGPRNFMMVNGGALIGSPLRQPVIWRQEVTVEQFTEYYFSAWAMNLNPGSPARLQFKINGQLVGTVLDLDNAPKPGSEAEVGLDNWREFRSDPSWSSGSATTAIIEIVNLNTALGGNDFALDDISFGTLSPFIRLTSAVGTDDSQVVCEDSPIVDIEYAVGGGLAGPLVTGLPAGLTATWNGVNLRISGTPTTPGEYTYEVFTTGSCQQVRVEGLIIVKDVPDAGTLASDQTVCAGDTPSPIIGSVYAPQDVGAVISYRWELNTDLSTPNWIDIPGDPSGSDFNPSALAGTTQFRRYTISTVGGLSCESPASAPVTITVQSEPTPGAIATDQTICSGGDPAAFTSTTAGTGDGTITYRWESAVSPFASWSTVSGANSSTYDAPAGLTVTTRFRRITISTLNSVDCESIPTAPVEVTVQSIPDAGAIATDQSICSGEDPVAFTSTAAGSGDGTITYRWESAVSPFSSWSTISGATGETYDAPAGLSVTTQFRRVAISTLNTAACEATTTPVQVTILPDNAVTPVDPDPVLCLAVASPVIITHTTTGATGIEPQSASVDYNLPNGVNPSWNAGVLTIQGTPTEFGVFNYSIPLTGGCGSVNAIGTITVENPNYPITSIDVVNPTSLPGSSTFTVFSPNMTPGTYEIVYSTNGVNGGLNNELTTVVVSTSGQFTLTSPSYSNEGTTVLTINSIQRILPNPGDPCAYYPPNNNTAIYGFGCSSESLQSGGDDTFYVPADVFELRIAAYGDGSPSETQTIPVIPGGVIFIGTVGNEIFATLVPLATATPADYIVSALGPNGRIVITYDCTPPPPCNGTGEVYQYTDSEGFTVIRVTGDCSSWSWTAPDGLDEFEVLVVGGGGGGGYGEAAGGGGGGAVIYQQYTGITMNGLPGLQGAVFQVAPGGLGLGATSSGVQGGDGTASTFTGPAFDYTGSNTFSDLSAAGGGGGGSSNATGGLREGRSGASGGGGAAYGSDESNGGNGTDGNNGGNAISEAFGIAGAGGGGAAANGAAGSYSGGGTVMTAGSGGNGESRTISGVEIFYGAGGGGTASGAITNEAGSGGSPYNGTFNAGGNGNNNGVGQSPSTYGSGGGAGRLGGSNGFQGVVYIRYPNFRILPVDYLYFNAKYNPGFRSGDLTWATAKEWENDRFEIERSVNDVKSWETIGQVTGAGYSDKPVEYTYQDLKLPLAGGTIFYRLKQINFNGDSAYSDTKAIQVEPMAGTTYWRVYPNPTTGDPINLEMLDTGVYNDEEITVRVIAATGQFEILKGTSQSLLSSQLSNILRGKAAGIYTVEISWSTFKEYHKVILRR